MKVNVNGRAAPRLGLILLLALCASVHAGTISFASQQFALLNDNADGTAKVEGTALVVTGGNNGSGKPGTTDVAATAAADSGVTFQYFFTTADVDPVTGDLFDGAGFLVGDSFTAFSPLLLSTPTLVTFNVAAGQSFGFRVETADNIGEPGVLTISDIRLGPSAQTPEPRLAWLVAGAGIVYAWFHGRRSRSAKRMVRAAAYAALTVSVADVAAAQQSAIKGADATGQMVLTRVAEPNQAMRMKATRTPAQATSTGLPEVMQAPQFRRSITTKRLLAAQPLLGFALTPGLSVNYSGADFGFDGLTHGDQRKANNGNQLSTEPPSPEIAVGKQFILAGVNDAIQVYDRSSGIPLLPKVLSTNELFGLPPAIDRATGIRGVFLNDMRVFYDHEADRWFVMQRAQDRDVYGNPKASSHLYLAVSQTGDPTGKYNVYAIDTTSRDFAKCPCISDYPEIAADKYAINITFDLYDAFYMHVGARILSISKAGLASGAAKPVTWDFPLYLGKTGMGFEGAVKPAATPPGASYFVASGGLQYFLSTNATAADDSRVALWALVNTASLATTPNLILYVRLISGVPYSYPDDVIQKPGPNPLGSNPYEYFPPYSSLALIDGGRDSRVLSLTYAGGRLYTTFATRARDEDGKLVVGGGYAILSPTYRAGAINALVLRQGCLVVKNNHVLRPAVAVNPEGKGAIVFTLAGPDYYPSVAFTPVETFSTATVARIAGIGVAPEDGFTGYDPDPISGQRRAARWGDYSGAVATEDGSIWMVGQYIPDLLRYRTNENWYAHWGTRIIRYIP